MGAVLVVAPADVVVPVVVVVSGMVRVCPARMNARASRSLAATTAETVVPWRDAIAETVSPERTVYVPAATLLAAGAAAGEAAVAVVPVSGRRRTWPTRMREGSDSALSRAIARVVVPERLAIDVRVSPSCTV